jgi:Protein of unknown function (DUF3054)
MPRMPSAKRWVRPALADAAALLVFVTVGLVSHRRGFGAGYARDLPAFLGSWLVAGALFRLYRNAARWRLVATWTCAVPAAVLLRALVLGHALNGSEAAFLVVSLVTIAVLVVGFRVLLGVMPPSRAGRRDVP